MAVTESFKIMASMWLFVRAFAKAVILYFNENKAPKQHQLKGKGLSDDVQLPENLPSTVDIKRSLPRQCFQPTVGESMFYTMKDLFQIAVCYYIFSTIHSVLPLTYWPTMIFYWAIQGTFFTAVFVVGHDCGHDSFSHYKLLNDTVGQIMHGFLLCPYYMWKLSHRHHHKHNADFNKDEVFYPVTESSCDAKAKVLPGFAFGIGWFVYLLKGYRPRPVPHYTPYHPMFVGNAVGCWLTVVALGTMSVLLFMFYQSQGLLALINYYFIPLFIFGSYIVIITFLHHTEMGIPWYSSVKWDFVRGQLSTIDRHYGIVHNIIHNIGTHQMHHMFTKIPHYHLEEATKHFRESFPDLVRTCEEPILPSFLRMFRKYEEQSVMKEETEVHFYKEQRS